MFEIKFWGVLTRVWTFRQLIITDTTQKEIVHLLSEILNEDSSVVEPFQSCYLHAFTQKPTFTLNVERFVHQDGMKLCLSLAFLFAVR